MQTWINNYFEKLFHLQTNALVTTSQGVIPLALGFNLYTKLVKRVKSNHNKLIFIGNGGNAGIASHLAIDYTKNGKMRAVAFSDAATLTCLSNDYNYDYENAFAKQLEFYSFKNDILIAISSSGSSKNIINAVSTAREMGLEIVTLSGFNQDNSLRALGDLNFYIDSESYSFVEVSHLSLCHAMLDRILDENHLELEKSQVAELVTE